MRGVVFTKKCEIQHNYIVSVRKKNVTIRFFGFQFQACQTNKKVSKSQHCKIKLMYNRKLEWLKQVKGLKINFGSTRTYNA